MGAYLNPGIYNFMAYINDRIYVDKSGMISVTNKLINGKGGYVSMIRPRRFGKSLAVEMLNAYYNIKLDTKELFSKYEISKSPDFEEHLNKYHVICFDINSEYTHIKDLQNSGSKTDILSHLRKRIVNELVEEFGDIAKTEEMSISGSVRKINEELGLKFVFIIDEWDCLLREESNNSKLIKEYINFLRSLFKGKEAEKCVALAYMTGILPIKKFNGESALNNFIDYTMVSPGDFAPYMGLTKEEVDSLCEEYGMDKEKMMYWYDGYRSGDIEHIYNPKSVTGVFLKRTFESFWSQTGIYKSVQPYITYNYEGMKDIVVRLIAGGRETINITKFSNDLNEVYSKDDALTVLIYLGYLTYDREAKEVFIPNEEIRLEFVNAVDNNEWGVLPKILERSSKLLKRVIEMDSETVADMLNEFHINEVPGLRYNEENALYNVINIAFFYTRDHYFHHYEMPAGKGFADIVYTPMPGKEAKYPPLIIELKYNKCALGAINQIKDKNYPKLLHKLGLQGKRCLLVGINYDDDKRHTCEIEEVVIE